MTGSSRRTRKCSTSPTTRDPRKSWTLDRYLSGVIRGPRPPLDGGEGGEKLTPRGKDPNLKFQEAVKFCILLGIVKSYLIANLEPAVLCYFLHNVSPIFNFALARRPWILAILFPVFSLHLCMFLHIERYISQTT
jgi:hypothetical protein